MSTDNYPKPSWAVKEHSNWFSFIEFGSTSIHLKVLKMFFCLGYIVKDHRNWQKPWFGPCSSANYNKFIAAKWKQSIYHEALMNLEAF